MYRAVDRAVKESQLAYSLNASAAIQITTIPAASSIQFWIVIPTTVSSPVKNCGNASIVKTCTRYSR